MPVLPGEHIVVVYVYDDICQHYPEHNIIAADSAYKTPWICKRIFESGRILTSAYTRPKTKEGGHPWYNYVYDEYFDDVICPEYKALHYSTTNRDGYDSKDGVLIPNQDAWVVKEIFKRFLEGQTYREISDGIVAMGAKSQTGKDHFSVETIRYMLSNETYVGDKLLQKQPPRDYITKKPDPNREYKPNYLTDDHEAIIDRETWNAVQEILKQREADNKAGIYRRSKGHHPLYGKVFCGECGAPFVRRTYKGRSGHYKAWNCKERQKGKKGNGCMNVIVKEDVLVQTVSEKLGADAVDRVQKVLVYKDRIEIV